MQTSIKVAANVFQDINNITNNHTHHKRPTGTHMKQQNSSTVYQFFNRISKYVVTEASCIHNSDACNSASFHYQDQPFFP